MTLQGKNILIVGGSSGIGFGVARAALGEGAAVTIASSNAARVSEAVARLGSGTGVCLDVTDEAAVQAFFADPKIWDHIAFTAADWAQVDHTDLSKSTSTERAKHVRGALVGRAGGGQARRAAHDAWRHHHPDQRHGRASPAKGAGGLDRHGRRGRASGDRPRLRSRPGAGQRRLPRRHPHRGVGRTPARFPQVPGRPAGGSAGAAGRRNGGGGGGLPLSDALRLCDGADAAGRGRVEFGG